MAVDYFIKFDGIKGESADAKHKDEIDIESWSWGETHPGRRARRRGGRGQGLDAGLPLRDAVEQGEPGLMKACATGQHLKMATLTARKAGKGQQDYLTFKFHDVLVSSFQTGGSEGPTSPDGFGVAELRQDRGRVQAPEGGRLARAPGIQFKYDLKSEQDLLAGRPAPSLEPVRAVPPPARPDPPRAESDARGRRARAARCAKPGTRRTGSRSGSRPATSCSRARPSCRRTCGGSATPTSSPSCSGCSSSASPSRARGSTRSSAQSFERSSRAPGCSSQPTTSSTALHGSSRTTSC